MAPTLAQMVLRGLPQPCPAPNLPTNIVDFRGFDSSIILILRGGLLMSTGDFPESLSQALFVGIMLVGRWGAPSSSSDPVRRAEPCSRGDRRNTSFSLTWRACLPPSVVPLSFLPVSVIISVSVTISVIIPYAVCILPVSVIIPLRYVSSLFL